MFISRKKNASPGVALLIVLSMVVIVCLILVAFVTAMRLERTASSSYSQSINAAEIARAGVNLVISDLQREMAADAPPDLTYPGRPIYTNVSTTNILPQKIAAIAAMTNLVRVSRSASFTNTAGTASGLKGSTNSSATPSLNGRYVDTNRWNAPYLGVFPDNASTPCWVFVTRAGATDGAGATFSGNGAINNPSPGNTNYAIGRFAYAVYDVGGLLDITIAGYPSTLSATQIQAIKGTLAGADVAAMGIDPNALTTWRNAASAASAANYLGYVTNFAATNGFRAIAPGDTTFLCRQDLIKAAKAGIAGLTTNTLASLTTFTRERNAPSWRPQTPAGSTIDYATLANNPASTNVFIPAIRYSATNTITGYKIDGTPFTYNVVPGDPLVSRRFPLDRIRWLGPSGPQNGGTDAAIQACFGLKWNSATAVWQYVGSTLPFGNTEQSAIKTLAQILAEPTPREPNFFELLQAGILSGSLAKDGDNPANPFGSQRLPTLAQQKPMFHVFRIGANILSQYESSSCPMVVEYNPAGSAPYWQACGIESLPYLNFFKPLGGTTSSPSSIEQYLVFSLWNPHQGTVPGNRPPVRLHVGGSFAEFNNYSTRATTYFGVKGYTASIPAQSVELSQVSGQGVNGFAEPGAPAQADLKTPPDGGSPAGYAWAIMGPLQKSPGDTTRYLGYRLPDFTIDTNAVPVVFATPGSPTSAEKTTVNGDPWRWLRLAIGNDTADPFNFWLEYQTPGGVWVPYHYGLGINDPAAGRLAWPFGMYVTGMGFGWTDATQTAIAPPFPPSLDTSHADPLAPWQIGTSTIQWIRSDPRSIRFNSSMANGITRPNWKGSLWSSTTESTFLTDGVYAIQAIPGAFYNAGTKFAQARLSRNNAPLATGNNPTLSYADPDGIIRPADSGLYTTQPGGGNGWEGDPYARPIDRPLILNRPFYSVGELGYAARDYPWRTLDFFTATSADAGLLDLFTTGQSTDPVVAGRVSLNTQNTAVLKAVLNNTIADVVGATPLSNPTQIATDLAAFTLPGSAHGPLLGREEIATRFAPSLGASDFGDTKEQKIKTRREGVARALADVAQTRTWNLMIDIVAQAGRYPPNATGLDQFIVEGERHYWLHVAIDRFTGEVLDRQLEVVTP